MSKVRTIEIPPVLSKLTREWRAVSIGSLLALFAGVAPVWADDLLRFGRIATLAPLCSVRDETWAFDLRRAEMQAATGSRRPEDDALKAAPGSGEAEAALSFAEHEALEEFAEASPARSCAGLETDDDLRRADEIVSAFRAQRLHPSGS